MNRADYELYGRRATQAVGTDIHTARLTPEDVREIRENRRGLTAKQWATRKGVHYRTIEKIRYFESWAHIT